MSKTIDFYFREECYLTNETLEEKSSKLFECQKDFCSQQIFDPYTKKPLCNHKNYEKIDTLNSIKVQIKTSEDYIAEEKGDNLTKRLENNNEVFLEKYFSHLDPNGAQTRVDLRKINHEIGLSAKEIAKDYFVTNIKNLEKYNSENPEKPYVEKAVLTRMRIDKRFFNVDTNQKNQTTLNINQKPYIQQLAQVYKFVKIEEKQKPEKRNFISSKTKKLLQNIQEIRRKEKEQKNKPKEVSKNKDLEGKINYVNICKLTKSTKQKICWLYETDPSNEEVIIEHCPYSGKFEKGTIPCEKYKKNQISPN